MFAQQPIPPNFIIEARVLHARRFELPVVALESAVITHGLPRPLNLELARSLESVIIESGATPATVALLDGGVHIGLTSEQLDRLAYLDGTRKISRRDFGAAIARGESGGTTVAATMIAAHAAGIRVFATGGIGGVHRGAPFDISADLRELGRTPLVVVCAGAKSILDLPATMEVLETEGVPVIGYGTNELPGFYTASSGLKVNIQADTPQEVARIARAHWAAGIESALLLVVPPPADVALPPEQVEGWIEQAVEEAERSGIRGSAVTPYLLARVAELSGGTSLPANLGLLRNNARIAAAVAVALSKATRPLI